MKRFIKTALTVVLAAAAVSCAKELEPQKEKINGTFDLSITGVINGYTPQEETKAEAQTVVRIMWKGGEKVYVFDGTECLGSLTASIEGTDGTYAKLTGTIEGTTATTLTFVYSPQFSETQAPAVTDGKISLDLSVQDDAEVPFLIYATMPTAQTQDPTSFSNEVVQFNLATSVFKCNCAGLGEDGEISQAAINGVNTKCELALSNNGAPEVSGTTPGTITRTDGFTKADQRAIFSVAVVKTDASAERNILVHQGSKVSGAPFTTATLAGGKSYNTVYQMCEYVPTPPDDALPGGFTINANGDRVYFSKGNLWADATDSNNPVFYFEEQQYDYPEGGYNAENTSHVSYFLWNKDAKQAVQMGTDSVEEYLAYYYNEQEISECYNEHQDDFVNILIRQIPDDVFFTNNPNFQVGTAPAGTYRTLTHEEWEYLFSYNESADNPDGKNYDNDIRRGRYKYGVKVCGKTNCVVLLPDNWDTGIISLTDFANKSEYNGESNPTWEEMEEGGAVCLPAAGNGDAGYEGYPVGEKGSYWSSTIMNDNPVSAYTEFFSDEGIIHGVGYEDSYRYEYSNSVRLVRSPAYAPAVKVTGVTLGKTETSIGEGSSETLAATVIPANATNKQIIWSSSKTSVATVDENGEVTGVAAGSAVITATTADGNFTAVCLVTVTEPYVIIGGLIWASKNLGATTVAGSYSTCYGDLYQCGSINTLYTGFPWTSATYGSFTFKEGKEIGFYSGNAELGEDFMQGVEGPAELPDENDVVMQKVGNGWRMPTKEDFSALCEACGGDGESNEVNYDTTTKPSGANATVGKGIYACTNYDGVAGCLFVDENGNKLFFPAAGYGIADGLYDAGYVGRYWSKTLNWSLKSMANCFEFDTNEHVKIGEGASDYDRWDGYSIRPVKDIN